MSRYKRRLRTFHTSIYIGKMDMDVAAWFNMLRTETDISLPKWVHYLLAAEVMKEIPDIGTISVGRQFPLPPKKQPAADASPKPGVIRFGEGSAAAAEETKKTNDRINPKNFEYGWHVRGPNGEYIYGSTISLCISCPETIELIHKVWTNGRQFSTYLKALIRSRLKYGPEPVPPPIEEYQRIIDQYLLAITHVPYDAKQAFEKPPELPEFETIPKRPRRPTGGRQIQGSIQAPGKVQSHPGGPQVAQERPSEESGSGGLMDDGPDSLI